MEKTYQDGSALGWVIAAIGAVVVLTTVLYQQRRATLCKELGGRYFYRDGVCVEKMLDMDAQP